MSKLLEKKIKKFLEGTRNKCKFKRAVLPKGWTMVHIDTCSKELAEKLEAK